MTRGRPSGAAVPAQPAPVEKAVARKAPARKAPAGKAPARKASARTTAAPTESATAGPGPNEEQAPNGAGTPAPALVAGPSDEDWSLEAGPAGRRRWPALTDPSSPALVYAGVVGVVAGFALLFVAWSEVAAQSDVWRQMPFVLSAGFPGLGLVMAGLVTASVGVRRQDGARRQRQMAALTEALRSLERRVG